MIHYFSLLVTGWCSVNVDAVISSDWEARVNSLNALYAESDLENINAEGYPGIYIPLIGNGYL